MSMMKKMSLLAFAAFTATAGSAGAQAQVTLDNGASVSLSTSQTTRAQE